MNRKEMQSRSRIYVDAKVQGTLVRQLIVHWLLACGLVLVYLLAMQAFSNGFELGFWENVAALGQRYGLLGAVLLVISPVFIYDSVKLSNRFVGPMISFRTHLNMLARGEDAPPLSFRHGDFWHDLTNEFNTVAAELKELRAQQRQHSTAPEQETADAS